MIETFILGVFTGLGIGMYIQKRGMHNIMVCKSRDGTSEFIDGQCYYILNHKDYCRSVLHMELPE